MSRLGVDPATLTETADRLRAADLAARRLRRALAEAGVEVTGSAELSAALGEHANAWAWCLERVHERVRAAARAVDGAAEAYQGVERAVADAAGAAVRER